MSQQETTNRLPVSTGPTNDPVVDEVDIEVGFVIGSTCCSLELEDDDDFESLDKAGYSEDA